MSEDHKPKESSALMVTVPAAFGIIVTSLALFLGATITSTWWASGISKQLELVIKQTSEASVMMTALQLRVSAIETWKAQVDVSGTPALAKRVEEENKSVQDLRRDFDIHKATEIRKP
jgi:hypothetical protein